MTSIRTQTKITAVEIDLGTHAIVFDRETHPVVNSDVATCPVTMSVIDNTGKPVIRGIVLNEANFAAFKAAINKL